MTLAARLELAVAIAREAGRVTLEHYQSETLEVERKADASPVTAADRAAERLLRERIQQAFPNDGIVGEEYGESPGGSEFRWVLDPIDGTKSFIHGVPLYGTLVGVERDRIGVVGVIHIPVLDETVYAAQGQGAWHVRGDAEPQAARCNADITLADGLLLTTSVPAFERRGARGVIQSLQEAASLSRTWGDCYGYLLVATGRAAAMIDPYLCVWDAAALQPVLEEAGGHFVDWQGRPTIHGGEGLGAANRQVLEAALEITRQAPPLT